MTDEIAIDKHAAVGKTEDPVAFVHRMTLDVESGQYYPTTMLDVMAEALVRSGVIEKGRIFIVNNPSNEVHFFASHAGEIVENSGAFIVIDELTDEEVADRLKAHVAMFERIGVNLGVEVVRMKEIKKTDDKRPWYDPRRYGKRKKW
jgi:hypothetical protein